MGDLERGVQRGPISSPQGRTRRKKSRERKPKGKRSHIQGGMEWSLKKKKSKKNNDELWCRQNSQSTKGVGGERGPWKEKNKGKARENHGR